MMLAIRSLGLSKTVRCQQIRRAPDAYYWRRRLGDRRHGIGFCCQWIVRMIDIANVLYSSWRSMAYSPLVA